MVKQSISKLKCFRRNGILQSNLSDAFRLTNVWKLMDENIWTGGIADSIPFEKAQELGCDKIIVVLTQPIDYRKTKSSSFYSSFLSQISTLS